MNPATLEFRGGKYICVHCDKVAYKNEDQAKRFALANSKPQRPYRGKACLWWHTTGAGAKLWLQANRAPDKPVPVATPISLRDYQEASIDFLHKYFTEKSGSPIIALPTGTGKSIIIAEFIRRSFSQWPGTRIMMLTHVKELIGQNYDTLRNVFPTAPVGIYSAGLKRKEADAAITFAGIQSVHRKAELFGHIDLVLIDECHLVSNNGNTMYRRFIDSLKETNPKLKVVGFSATPYRLSSGMLTDPGGIFTDVAFDLTDRKSFNWLIQERWLAPVVPKRTHSQLDLTGVAVQGGEYVLKQMQAKVDQESVTIAALKEAVHLASDRKHWLVFASGIDHAEHIAGYLEDIFNISSTAVHNKVTDRDERIAAFKEGRVQVMVNNNILTTGFDFPEIDCIVMLRPTQSPGLWVQMLGRGTRPAEGKKDCLVLDFAGNTERLGPINDPVLPRRSRKGRGPKGVAPVRLCEHCLCYSHASARHCEHCNAEFPKSVKIGAAASSAELIAGDIPSPTSHKITKVLYSLHKKQGKPDSMRVTYYCGLRHFNEYICLDHGGYATKVAQQWWELRSPWGVPPNAHEGMKAIDYLRTPSAIGVIEKGKYPEIITYTFDDN